MRAAVIAGLLAAVLIAPLLVLGGELKHVRSW